MTTAAQPRARLVRCDVCRLLHPEDARCPEPCYQCGGSGEAPDMSAAGVPNWRYLVDCEACDGTGAERGALR